MKVISRISNLMDHFIQRLWKHSLIVIIGIFVLVVAFFLKLAYDNWRSDVAFSSARALLSDAKKLSDEGNYENAYQRFDSLATGGELRNYPGVQAEAVFRAAFNLQMLDRYDEALERYDDFIAQFPDSPWVENTLYASGLCYANLQNYEAARKSFRELLNRFPNSQFKDGAQKFIKESLIQDAQVLLSKPKALFDEENYEDAYQEFNKLATSDELRNYPGVQAEAVFRAAFNLQMLDRHDEALERYDDFIAQFPDSPWVENALYASGLCYTNLQDYEACRDILQKLLNSYPESTFKDTAQRMIKESFLREAQTLLNEENYEDAYQEFNRLATEKELEGYSDLQTEARSKATYSFLKQVGRNDEELIPYIDFLTQSTETQFVEDNALFNIGLLTFKLQNYDVSLRAFEQLRESVSDSALKESALYNIGIANYNLQDYAESHHALTEFLSEFPNSRLKEKALYNRGRANYNLHDHEDSRSDFGKLLDDFPKSEFKQAAERFIARSFLEEVKMLLDAKKYKLAYQEFDRHLTQGKYNDYEDLKIEATYTAAYSLKQLAIKEDDTASDSQARGDYNRAETYAGQAIVHYDSARSRYIQFISDFPKSQYVMQAYMDIGDIDVRHNNYVAARANYESALENTDDLKLQVKIQVKIARTYHDQGEAKETIDAYTRLLEEYPAIEVSDFITEAKRRIADSHFRLKNWENAASAYLEAYGRAFISNDKSAAYYVYQAAEAYYKLGKDYKDADETGLAVENFGKALTWYQFVLDEFPTDAVASHSLYAAMDVLSELKYQDELEQIALENVVSEIRHLTGSSDDIDLKGLSYFMIALTQEEHIKDYPKALENYKDAITYVEHSVIKAQAYYRTGRIYQNKLDLPDRNRALQAFKILIDEYGKSENMEVASLVTNARIHYSKLSNNVKSLELNSEQIGKKARASTVLLKMNDTSGRMIRSGSGFFVRPSQIATNYHVVQGSVGGYAEPVGESFGVEENPKYTIQGYTAIDIERDLIILKVSGLNPPPLPLGDSDMVERNNQIYAVGTPLGHGAFKGTISPGIISNILKNNIGKRTYLSMTAPVSPGNSGGPVLNNKGQVIGIAVSQVLRRDPKSKINRVQNLNLAIPSNDLTVLLEKVAPPKPLQQAELAK